jgi:TPP-dependent pyruvate/acetoin dehydrogenase alpha subunit
MQAKFAEFREEHDLQEPPKTFEEWLKARGLFDEAKLEAIVGPIRMKSKEAEKPIQKKENSAKEEKPLPVSDNEIGKNSEQPGVL